MGGSKNRLETKEKQMRKDKAMKSFKFRGKESKLYNKEAAKQSSVPAPTLMVVDETAGAKGWGL